MPHRQPHKHTRYMLNYDPARTLYSSLVRFTRTQSASKCFSFIRIILLQPIHKAYSVVSIDRHINVVLVCEPLRWNMICVLQRQSHDTETATRRGRSRPTHKHTLAHSNFKNKKSNASRIFRTTLGNKCLMYINVLLYIFYDYVDV